MSGGKHFSMVRSFHVADLFTLANGASGTAAVFLALHYAMDGDVTHIQMAGVVVFAALVFDVLDGRIARWRHRASAMGKELDSLSDVISFGVAPASLAYSVGIRGVWDIAILLYFVCCGISRLARYNITADSIAAETGEGKVTYFEGTPIPTSVLLVALIVILASVGAIGPDLPLGSTKIFGGTFHPLVLLFAVSGSLMISKTVRIPKP